MFKGIPCKALIQREANFLFEFYKDCFGCRVKHSLLRSRKEDKIRQDCIAVVHWRIGGGGGGEAGFRPECVPDRGACW